MKHFKMFFVILILSILLVPQAGYSCTAFCLDQDSLLLVGKNYDWNIGDGLMIINKRNVSKIAATPDNPASWISRYGSVTFNQYGRELPNGGMNEAGLVIEVLWLNSAEYPQPDKRQSVSNLQWIQYNLDNSSSVEEVIASDNDIRIASSPNVKVHFFVCDSTGKCATIEFLNGKLVYHAGETMPMKAISNNTYDESIEYAKQFESYGGNLLVKERDRSVDPYSQTGSLDRFFYAADMVKKFNSAKPQTSIDYMYDILNTVDSGSKTQWSIVYNIKQRRIYFKSASSPKIKYINFSDCEFDCDSPVTVFDINARAAGDIGAKFKPYTREINKQLLEKAFANTGFLRSLTPEALDQISAYPESMVCTKK